MAVAFLKERSLGRILAGHPWIFTADMVRVEKPPEDGEEIIVRTSDGNYVGTGFYNSKSRIPIRIFSRSKEKLDEDFFRRKILEAKALRENLLIHQGVWQSSKHDGQLPTACRVVWSEADFLPGLIVDHYDDAWVIQTLTLAMDRKKEMIVNLLKEIFGAKVVIERNDLASRQFEGLPLQKNVLAGQLDGKKTVVVGKAHFEVDLMDGQKTGLYLDQIESHKMIGGLSKGRKVLDCFTYHGGFAIYAALGGASEVEALDISENAIAMCRRNMLLSGINHIKWKAANVFDELHARQRSGERFDLIVLDPPSFTKSRAKLNEALRGYKEIHLRALKLLSAKGLLATFCCSHHVDAETFRAVVLDAAFDAHKILRQHHIFSQPLDHPIIPSIPETEYLKGFLFEVV